MCSLDLTLAPEPENKRKRRLSKVASLANLLSTPMRPVMKIGASLQVCRAVEFYLQFCHSIEFLSQVCKPFLLELSCIHVVILHSDSSGKLILLLCILCTECTESCLSTCLHVTSLKLLNKFLLNWILRNLHSKLLDEYNFGLWWSSVTHMFN